MPNGDKQTVVILGGGCGAVTAAFELTATQELRDRFEVELYTLGWRLGGKGASGRNRDHSLRIEGTGCTCGSASTTTRSTCCGRRTSR